MLQIKLVTCGLINITHVDALMDKIFIKIIPILEYLYLSIMHALYFAFNHFIHGV